MDGGIVFLAEEAPDSGYTARAVGRAISTDADVMDGLRRMVRNTVTRHHPQEQGRPKVIRLHWVRDEVIAA